MVKLIIDQSCYFPDSFLGRCDHLSTFRHLLSGYSFLLTFSNKPTILTDHTCRSHAFKLSVAHANLVKLFDIFYKQVHLFFILIIMSYHMDLVFIKVFLDEAYNEVDTLLKNNLELKKLSENLK